MLLDNLHRFRSVLFSAFFYALLAFIVCKNSCFYSCSKISNVKMLNIQDKISFLLLQYSYSTFTDSTDNGH